MLLVGGVLSSCCIGAIVIGAGYLSPRGTPPAEKPPGGDDFPPRPEPEPIAKGDKDNAAQSKDGADLPPPKLAWPVAVKLDEQGLFSMTAAFEEPTKKAPRPSRQFRLLAKADVAYVVELVDAPGAGIRAEPADGGPAIVPKAKPAPPNQLVLWPPKDEFFSIVATPEAKATSREFTLRVRAWDESEPLPAPLLFPAPDAPLPDVKVALSVPKTMLVGGAFAPNSKSFWLAGHDMTLSLWQHPALTRKGAFKLTRRLYALAVDGKGRLYAQPGPPDTSSPILARRTLGEIVVYEDLEPKGDADELPPPARSFLINGLIGRMIASPDRRSAKKYGRQPGALVEFTAWC